MQEDQTKVTPDSTAAQPFATSIWAETLDVIKRNPKAATVCFSGAVFMSWLFEDRSFDWVSMILETLIFVALLIPVFFSLLKDRNDVSITSDYARQYLFKFLYRTFMLITVSYAPAVLLGNSMLQHGFSNDASDIALALLFLTTFSVVFALWGTMLPAIIGDGDWGFGAAFKRSRRVFIYAFSRLLLAFLIVIALFFSTSIPVIVWGNGSTELYSTTSGFRFLALYWHIISSTCVVVFNVVFAIIMARSYLVAERRLQR